PQAPRVRHRRAPRPHHQTGFQAGAVGRCRSHPALSHHVEDRARPHPDRVTPRQEHRQDRRGTQTAHPGLLRAARRTYPLGVKGFRYRRVKNDVRDAADLADLLRMGRLPEAWIAPPQTRELRELVRYRAKLVAIRSGLKAQIHGVLAKAGVLIAVSDLFGVTGRQRLAKVPLGPAYAQRIRSLLELINILDSHEARFAVMIAQRLDTHAGYQAIQQVPGIGPTLAAVFVAEIGDVHRFTDAAHLCSWAGLTPRHRESDTVVHRGHITKQGSKAVRWAAIEAVQRHPTTAKIAADKHRIEARRGKNIAKVAAARKLLTLIYYGLRDGQIRALDRTRAA